MQSPFPNYNQRQRGNVKQVQVKIKPVMYFSKIHIELLTLSLWVVRIN